MLSRVTGVRGFCAVGELRCADGTCVATRKIMDGVRDCVDGKYDETGPLCFASQLHCANGTCMARSKFLNGVNDCGDNSDEVALPCTPPQFSCVTEPGRCINMSQVQDGHVHCDDASDEVKSLGDDCIPLEECGGLCKCELFVNHSVCNNGTCECSDGYYGHKNRKQCILRTLGDGCSVDEDCDSVMNSTHCLQERCHCRPGHVQENATSCRSIAIGDACTMHTDCNPHLDHSTCDHDKCVCDIGFAFNNESELCTKRKISESCSTDPDCDNAVENSQCSSNMCSCNSGYFTNPSRNYCLRRKLHDACEIDPDCSSVVEYGECRNDKCACHVGRKPDDLLDFCIFNQIGDVCSLDLACSSAMDNGYCENTTCSCVPGYQAHVNKTECNRRRIFDGCNSDADCHHAINDSVCFSNVCLCDIGYIELGNFSSCRLRTLGDICDINVDCDTAVEFTECKEHMCQCMLGYQSTEGGSSCQMRRIEDSTCTSDEDCYHAVAHSLCTENTCVCTSGFLAMYNNTTCRKRTITSTCVADNDCTDAVYNSTCAHQTCECSSGFKSVQNNSECALRDLGDDCNSQSDCSNSVLYSNCTENYCVCQSGFSEIENRTKCSLRNINDFCYENSDCYDAIEHSYCHNNTCRCIHGFRSVTNNSQCVLNKITDTCVENKDCSFAIYHSECKHKTCTCKGGYQDNQSRDTCTRRRILDTCNTFNDCSLAVSDSDCHMGICVCDSGFFASDGNETCTRFRIGDTNCASESDCSSAVKHSLCRQTTCTCHWGYMAADNNTICQKRRIEDACDVMKDCESAVYSSHCSAGRCRCVAGHDATPAATSCVPRPRRLLDGCTFSGQCRNLDNQSVCSSSQEFPMFKLCTCKDGLLIRNDLDDVGQCYVPKQLGGYCKFLFWCKTLLGDNVICTENACLCKTGYLPNATNDGCIIYAEKVGAFCREDEHCVNIAHAQCVGNSTCQCHYKYRHNTDGTACHERPWSIVPSIPEVQIGRQCDNSSNRYRTCRDRVGTRCRQIVGRTHSRCACVPGYASKYNETIFKCQEVQTYYINMTISEERGCANGTTPEDDKLCHIYQPIVLLRQYTNPRTRYYTYFRDRLIVTGLAVLFNTTTIASRYVTSEIVNITKVHTGISFGILLYFVAEHANIIPNDTVTGQMGKILRRANGVLGNSQLKLTWPFQIEYKDFDECTEQGGAFHDCSPLAWCLNTAVSYMCSCRPHYEDISPDRTHRPGRVCIVPPESTTLNLSCSSGDCETKWEYLGLALALFTLMMFSFIGYEIYSRKKQLDKSDIYYKIRKAARHAKLKALKQRRKTVKRRKKGSPDRQTDGSEDNDGQTGASENEVLIEPEAEKIPLVETSNPLMSTF